MRLTTPPRVPSHVLPRAAAALLATLLAAPGARAQMLALPVVQAPFPGRLFAAAVNAGAGGDGLRTLGAAVALRRGGSRLTGTLGAGAVQGFATTRPSFGVRVAYLQPLGSGGALAAAPFIGFGALSRGDSAKQASSANDRPRLAGSVTVIPAGVGLGYRRLVAGRAVAVHVTPHAQYWRAGGTTVSSAGARAAASKVYVRAGLGLDAAVTRQIGLALAFEAGASSKVTGAGAAATGLAEGPRPALFGVAVSYTPRRAQPGAGGGR